MFQRLRRKREKLPTLIKPRTYRPIHLGTLIATTIAAFVITGIASSLMWDAAKVPAGLPNSPDLAVRAAQLRVDVIRNILAVGAGTGGLIALFVALRRQYVKERVDHADQEYKNRTAEDTKHDAAERRVTDLYVKAAEQLGSNNAAVRLAALYSLERLGQGDQQHRKTIVSLICAYLRMPFLPPGLDGLGSPDEVSVNIQGLYDQEKEVKSTAQRILREHLTYDQIVGEGSTRMAVGSEQFWPGMEVNLIGALLDEVSFYKCAVAALHMEKTQVRGVAEFGRLFCPAGNTVDISEARFNGPVTFPQSEIASVLLANGAKFLDTVDFSNAKLRMADFTKATFLGPATFENAEADFVNLSGARARHLGRFGHVWPKRFHLEEDGKGDDMGTLKWDHRRTADSSEGPAS